MINLRYHIVSLTAVFLALGIGVLLGGTYLDKYTVDQLDQSITSAEERIRETRAENDRLRGEIGDADARNRALLEAGTPQLFGSHLTDVPVLVVAPEGIDETSRRNLVRALANSGADFRGTLTVTSRMALEDDGDVDELAELLEVDDATSADVRAELVDRFGSVLAAAGTPPDAVPSGDDAANTSTTAPAQPVDPTAPTTVPQVPPTTAVPETPTARPEILSLLLDQGLLSFEEPTRPSASGPLLSEQGYRFVFISGEEPAVADSSFLVPVLRRMADEGPVPVAVVSATPTEEDGETAVERIRGDAELSRLVSTVDNLESFNGIASTVLALDEIGRGARGHYGDSRGAAAPLPSGT